MPSIESIQAEMTAAIICGNLLDASRVIAGDGLDPERRLAIHRHHYVITMIEALGATFPVIKRVLGERVFAQAAQWFICVSPPASPCLFEYGEEFVAFIASHPSAAALAHVGDVARFEWAINRAYHAPDVAMPPAPDVPASLAGKLVAVVAPHVALIESSFPLAAIWEAHQGDEAAPAPLDGGGVRLAVFRRGLDVLWRALGPGEAALLAALRAGRPLAIAFDQAVVAEAGFDLAPALSSFAGEGLILGFRLPTVTQEVPS